ncbi:hypothetical protein HCA78_17495, partial [Listeria booriae]
MGKGYVPHVPLYVLIILQSIDNKIDLAQFHNQSNGYYYEVLIKQLINSVGVNNNNEVATLHNYLNRFAYRIFSSNERTLSYSEWQNFHNDFVELFAILPRDMKFNVYMDKLISCRILKQFEGDRYSFNFNYTLYYFTAQYLAEHIDKEVTKDSIKNMVDNVDIELNANVLIFLAHLVKGEFIIETVMSLSDELLNETE